MLTYQHADPVCLAPVCMPERQQLGLRFCLVAAKVGVGWCARG